MTRSTESTLTSGTWAAPDSPGRRLASGVLLHIRLESTNADGADADGDATELATALESLAALVTRTVSAHSGTVIGPITTELRAWFGTASAAIAEDAADAALALRSVLQAARAWPRLRSLNLVARLGLDAGELVFVGPPGEPPSLVHGPPLLGARALAESAGAFVLKASAGVVRRLRGGWITRGDASGAEIVGRAVPSALLGPFTFLGVATQLVGREREAEILRAALDATSHTGAALLVLTGPPGVGKTRLVSEVVAGWQAAQLATIDVLQARTGAHFGSYGPLAIALRQRARIRDADPAATAARRFVSVLTPTTAAEEVLGIATALATLVGAIGDHLSDYDVSDYDAYPRGWLFDALVTWYRGASTGRPLVVFLDGLDAMPPPVLDALEHLLSRLGEARVLFVATANDPPSLDRFGRHRASELVVGRLEPAVTEALASYLLRCAEHVPARLIREVAEFSGGLPLAVEEALRDLAASGRLRTEARPWRIEGRRGLVLRPADAVTDAYAARIAMLTEAQREALAAVAVSPAHLDVLGPTLGIDGLEALLQRGFLESRGDVGGASEGASFTVAHPAVAEAALRALPPARRADLHRSVAARLEHAGLATAPKILADHWSLAGDHARALTHRLRHAEQVLRQRTPGEAARVIAAAIATLDQLPQTPENDAVRERLIGSQVEQLVLAAELDTAVELGGREGPRLPRRGAATARLHLWTGWAFEHSGRLAEARAAFEQASDAMPDADGELAVAILTGTLAVASRLGGGPEVGARLEARLATDTAGVSSRTQSAAHRLIGNLALREGRFPDARRAYERAHELALAAHAPEEVADALNALVAVLVLMGEFAAATALSETGLREAERWDLAHVKAYLLTNLAEAHLGLGQTAPAIDAATRALAAHLHVGNEEGVGESHRLLAEAHLALAALDEARQHALGAFESAQRFGAPFAIGSAARALAAIAVASGDTQAAARHFDQAVRTFRDGGLRDELDRTEAKRLAAMA